MSKLFATLAALVVMSGCALSPEIQQSRASNMLTVELCYAVINNDFGGGEAYGVKQRAYRNELRKRNEDCTGHKDLKKSEGGKTSGTVKIIVKDCSQYKSARGFWQNMAKGAAGC